MFVGSGIATIVPFVVLVDEGYASDSEQPLTRTSLHQVNDSLRCFMNNLAGDLFDVH